MSIYGMTKEQKEDREVMALRRMVRTCDCATFIDALKAASEQDQERFMRYFAKDEHILLGVQMRRIMSAYFVPAAKRHVADLDERYESLQKRKLARTYQPTQIIGGRMLEV